MVITTKTEKLLFPLFVLLFEVAFLILLGTLVEYDEGGAPHTALNGSARVSQSSRITTKAYPFFQDVHVMIFVGFGFLMTFLHRYGYGSIGFNMLLASFAIQWSTITSGLLSFIGQIRDGAGLELRIRVNLETLVGSDFAAAAVLITMGAVLGRASPFQLVIIAFFELMFYSANEAFNIHVLQAADVGGSMLIHTFGAYFGLAVSIMLYNKKATDHPRNSTVYHSDLFAMIGTLFLWLYWPSFNAALASGNAQNRAIINTYYSMTGSVFSTFIFSMVLDSNRKLNMTHIQNATLAGGVAVGSVANMVIQPWGAVLIGFLAGFYSVVGYCYFSPIMDRWLYLQDTCGVHNLHGLPGVFSGLASALVASVAEEMGGRNKAAYGNSLYVVFPARAPTINLTTEQLLLGIEPGEGRHAGTQAGYQLALLTSTLAISIFGGLLTGLIVRWRFFQAAKSEHLFSDAAYWNLPDSDDNASPTVEGKPQLVIAAGHSSERVFSSHEIPLRNMPPSDDDIEGYVVENVQVEEEGETERKEEKTEGKADQEKTEGEEEKIEGYIVENVQVEDEEEETEGEEEKTEVKEEKAEVDEEKTEAKKEEVEEVEGEKREVQTPRVSSGEKIQVVVEVH